LKQAKGQGQKPKLPQIEDDLYSKEQKKS